MNTREKILYALREEAPSGQWVTVTLTQWSAMTDVTVPSALYAIRQLVDQGKIERETDPSSVHSTKRYRLKVATAKKPDIAKWSDYIEFLEEHQPAHIKNNLELEFLRWNVKRLEGLLNEKTYY